jgi:hypothetical protein
LLPLSPAPPPSAWNGWNIAKHLCLAQPATADLRHAAPLQVLEIKQACLQGTSMQSWQKFLDSLATKGGNLLVLFVCFAGLLGLLIHVLHHADTGDVTMVVVATFSGFSGALMATLTGKDSKELSEHVPGNKAPGETIPSRNNPGAPGTLADAGAVAIPESAGAASNDNPPKIDGHVL